LHWVSLSPTDIDWCLCAVIVEEDLTDDVVFTV